MTWNALRGRPVRVLIVDDEAPICRAVSLALEQAAYEVASARSAEAAYSLLKAAHYDILIIDLRIPDERGDVIFEFAAGEQPHLRYASLFLTGDISDQAAKLMAACKIPILLKPFELDDLLNAVASLAPRTQDAAG
jgi:two-component system OmpR family response regulator